jgi:L-ascorbate metabolism protein UlaG (beta-lactamase superfamily)
MQLQKLGHCCLVIETARARFLIDPGCLSVGVEDLTGLTGVLITHNHEDHLDVERLDLLLGANPDAQVLCDEASAMQLSERGIAGHVVHGGDRLDLGTSIRIYGDEHAVIHPDLPTVPNVGYLVADRFFYAGDAFTVPDRPVEVLAVPVGAPWMKVAEAVEFLRSVNPRIAIPVHDHGNVFAEFVYHLFGKLGPEGTTVRVLDSRLVPI